MRKLPQYPFNEGFYIWFDVDSKEEYYSTPLYMYKTDFNDDLENFKRKIIREKNFYKKKTESKRYSTKTSSYYSLSFCRTIWKTFN